MFKPSALGPLEQQIVSIVWKNKTGNTTVSSVMSELSDQQLAYTTIMTVLNRLVEKGFLTRTKFGRSYTYQPVEQKNSLLKELIRKTIASFVNTFGEEAIATFAHEASELSEQQKSSISDTLQSKKRKL